MKIAWLVYGDINQITGGYLYDKHIIHYLKKQEYDIDVINIPQLPYFLNTIWNFWLPWHLRRKSYDLIIEDELIHPAVFIFNWWVKWRKYSRLAALVHHFKWLETQGWRQSIISGIEKKMIKPVGFIIANSKITKKEIMRLNYPERAITVIYPGLNRPTEMVHSSPQKGAKVRLLFVGNCIFRKGLHILVDAIAQLGNPNLYLDIVGGQSREPKYVRHLKKRVSSLHLEDMVSFHGEVNPSHIWRWYAQADVFVAPSLYEGYGMVFAEAMSFGLPIIATRVGGIPEVVEDGKTGILIPPNDVESLAQSIKDLYEDSEKREYLSQNEREKAKLLPNWSETGKKFQQAMQYYLKCS